MKISVVYCSITGHSKKIAKKLAGEVGVEALNVKNDPKIIDVDLLFIVGGIYGSQSLPELVSYVEKLDNNSVKKVALITSCTSNNTKQNSIREILKNKNIEVLKEEFVCQGSFLLLFGFGHPNNKDIENAISYAKNIIKEEQK